MRVAKCIVLTMLLIFGVVMQNEIFQRELMGIGTDRYLSAELSYSSDFTEEAYDNLISDIENVSRENGVHPYAILSMITSDIESRVDIYCDDFVRSQIQQIDGVHEQEYISLLSGRTAVSFHPFAELVTAEEMYLYSVVFIGDSSDIEAVCDALSGQYQISHPTIREGNEADMTYVIWLTIDVVMVVMTVLFVAVRKKEIVIKISMGQNPKTLILKNILTEIVSDFLVFLFVKWFCAFFISGEYMEWEFALIYAAGVALCSLLYLSFAIYDIRMAFSNALVSKRIFRGVYCLKFLVTLGTIFTISTNIDLIRQNMMSISNNEFIKGYEDYYYMDIGFISPAEIEGADINKMYETASRIYAETYEECVPVVSELVETDVDRGADYVLVNEYGAGTIKNFLEGIEMDADTDVAVFVPERLYDEETLADADFCLSHIIEDSTGLKRQIFVYKGSKSFSYVNRNLNNNLSRVRNPVVVFACFDGSEYKDRLCNNSTKNVMFRLAGDAEKKDVESRFREQGYKVILTNAAERFGYYNAFLKQGIAFCSSIAIFMFLLQLILIYVAVVLEYKNNALELSLKKVLGYGFLQRSRFFLLKSMLFGVIAMLASMLMGVLTGWYKASDGLLYGIVLVLAEVAMDLCFILKNERENTIKVLKGGCL